MQRLITCLIIGVLSIAFVGCSDWWGGNDLEPELPTVTVHEGDEPQTPVLPDPEPLELSLEVGQYFPMKKVVDETLIQHLAQGRLDSHRRLELLLSLNVEEKREGYTRLSVKYHRVKFDREIGGQKTSYDSAAPAAQVPWNLLAFQGLVNNGFSFWIGADNQLTKLEAFEEFLARCVQNVPPQHKEVVMSSFIAVSGDEEIANFVDDSIGLLPFNATGKQSGSKVRVGDSWRKERQVVRPIPVYYNDEYTLERLDERAANILVNGEIAPSTSFGPSEQEQSKLGVKVTGGKTTGECLIDRKTGLPIRSEVLRQIDMQVSLNDGSQFRQQKRVTTVIEAFPHQESQQQPASLSPVVRKQQGNTGRIQQVGANSGPNNDNGKNINANYNSVNDSRATNSRSTNSGQPQNRVVPASGSQTQPRSEPPRFKYAENN